MWTVKKKEIFKGILKDRMFKYGNISDAVNRLNYKALRDGVPYDVLQEWNIEAFDELEQAYLKRKK